MENCIKIKTIKISSNLHKKKNVYIYIIYRTNVIKIKKIIKLKKEKWDTFNYYIYIILYTYTYIIFIIL